MEIVNKLKNIEDIQYIHRFIDFPKLLDLIISGEFYFARLDQFNDKSEAISKQQLIKHLYPRMWTSEPEKKELKLKTRQRRYFATCWFSRDRESFSMWNLYSNPTSVSIKYDIKDFMKLWTEKNIELSINIDFINRLYIGKIEYKNYLDRKAIFDKKRDVTGLYKDKSYKDENEIRVLFKCKGNITNENGNKLLLSKVCASGLRLKLKNFKKVPFSLVFHPQMKEVHKDNIKKMIKKFGYSNISFSDSELTKLLKFK